MSGSHENLAVMVAIGVNDDGCREVIGAAEGFTESKECRRDLLSWLRGHGLHGARMFAGDKSAVMTDLSPRYPPEAAYQRCTARFYSNILAKVPKSKCPAVAVILKAVHAMESREASGAKAAEAITKLKQMRFGEEAKAMRDGFTETLTCTRFPRAHWRRIRTNNAIERLDREIGRRTLVVGTFPDGKSALMLAIVRLRRIAESEWGSRRYLDATPLDE